MGATTSEGAVVASARNIAAEDSLTKFLQKIHISPMLPRGQKVAHAGSWRERQNSEAAHQLVTFHLRLAAMIAMDCRGYGLPVANCCPTAPEPVLALPMRKGRAWRKN